MQRDYAGQKDTVSDSSFFVGTEIEKTPAYGRTTLFVVGLQDTLKIRDYADLHYCDHIYLGANHSFDGNDIQAWEDMAKALLGMGFLVTLDFDVQFVEDVHECNLSEHNRFIPVISVKIPFESLFNYNTCVKIDDKDFNNSNPGVWVHPLHDLKSRDKFTDWSEYSKDKIIRD